MTRPTLQAPAVALFLLIFVLLPVASRAIDPPHETGSVKGYKCATCHTTHMKLGTTGYTNICLGCHRVGADPWGEAKAFSLADPSNRFGSYSSLQNANQTSHNWAAPDVNPAAGALPPLNYEMNKRPGYMSGRVTCVRCHGIHNYRNDPTVSQPYLRGMNDRDQMCLDCHRPRNKQSHLAGTHPVNVGYSTAYRTAPSAFRPAPELANAANPSTRLPLKQGLVLCTTCHKPHKADSAGDSFDSYSAGRLKQQASKAYGLGVLLRTDQRGKSTSDINICTACHAGKNAHDNARQNIQCADCHGGHVAYDPNNPNAATNVYLVRRYMNYSSPSGWRDNLALNRPTFFQETSAQRRLYKSPAETGVCQGCHRVPLSTELPAGRYPVEHDKPMAFAVDCTPCHSHSGSLGSFSGGCTGCHGFPPKTSNRGGPDGLVSTSGGTGAATSGSHAKHAGSGSAGYACAICHNNGMPVTAVTGNNKIQIGFNSLKNSTAGGSYNGRTTLANGYSYEAGNAQTTITGNGAMTCSVYCHGSTMSVAGDRNGGSNITPTWGTATTGQCGSCHGATMAAPPIRGSHRTHTGNGTFWHAPNTTSPFNNYVYNRQQPCSVCHANYQSKHVDGSADLSFDKSAYPWLAGAAYRTMTSSSISPVPSTSYGQCNNLYCHSIVQTSTGGPLTGLPGEYKTPTWGNLDTGTCGSCHLADQGHSFWADRGMGAPMIGSGSHAIHLTYLTASVGGGAGGPATCAACHNYLGNDNLSGCASVCHNRNDMHVDHRVDVKFPPMYGASAAYTGTPQPGDGFGSCTNTYCHSTVQADGGVGQPTYGAPAWGTSLSSCNSTCHGVGGHGSASTIATGSHTKHLTYLFGLTPPGSVTGRCTICHHWPSSPTDATLSCIGCHTPHNPINPAPLAQPGVLTKHVNGVIDIAFNTAVTTGAYNAIESPMSKRPQTGYSACTNTYCHSNGVSVSTGVTPANSSPVWGSGAMPCTGCHDFPPAYTNGSPKANSHDIHSAYGCNVCHALTTSDGISITSTQYHVNKAFNVNAGGGASFTYTYYSTGGTCADISCHSGSSATWGRP